MELLAPFLMSFLGTTFN